MYVFPWRHLPILRQRTYLTGQAKLGPASIDGSPGQSARTDGGGWWRSDCDIAIMHTTAVKCGRAWSAYLDGGVTEFIMPALDLVYAPRPTIGGIPQPPSIPPMPETFFATEIGYGESMVQTNVSADAALRATSLSLTFVQGLTPTGGEHFSIEDDTLGWRMHRLVNSADDVADTMTWTIRPPLRAAITASLMGPQLNFDMPCFVAKIHPDSAAALDAAISLGRLGETVTCSFIESLTQ